MKSGLKRFELLQLGIAVLSQLLFLVIFLVETKGVVSYADWTTVEGHQYYSTMNYQAGKLLVIGVFVVIAFETMVTLYGIWTKSYLATFAIAVGMLLYFGFYTQIFYNGGKNLEKQILVSVAGIVLMWGYHFLSRVRLKEHQGKYIRWAIALLIVVNLLSLVVNLIQGKSNNGSYAWVQFGNISFQPGEFLKVLVILLSAWTHRYRDNFRITKMYLVYCAASVVILVFSRDLGNAVILLCVCLIASWFIYGKWWYTIGVMMLGGCGIVAAAKYVPYVSERFEECFRALESGAGQHYDSLIALLQSGLLGCSPTGNTVSITHVTSSATDFVFNTFVGVWGLPLAMVLLGCIILLFVQMLKTPVVSPFHYLQGVLGVTTICMQYFTHMAGNLNVLPLTGVCANFVSIGGSNMLSSFMILSGILSCLSPGFEPIRRNIKRSYTKGDFYDQKNEYETKSYAHIYDCNDVDCGGRWLRRNWKKGRYRYRTDEL